MHISADVYFQIFLWIHPDLIPRYLLLCRSVHATITSYAFAVANLSRFIPHHYKNYGASLLETHDRYKSLDWLLWLDIHQQVFFDRYIVSFDKDTLRLRRDHYKDPFRPHIPSQLENLVNLVSLDLDSVGFCGSLPASFGNLKNLEFLSVTYGRLTHLPAELNSLHKLRVLLLTSNKISCLPQLSGLVQLQTLRLQYNAFKEFPTTVSEISNLVSLDLTDNSISGSVPRDIANLKNLEVLLLDRNQITDIPSEIANMARLRMLCLKSNRISVIPSEFGNLARIVTIDCNSNQIMRIPPELGRLNSLEHLCLTDNQLQGHIPAELGNLSSLRSLELSGNRLDGSIPPELGNLLSLEALYLENNQLSGTLPATFSQLKNLETLPFKSTVGRLKSLHHLCLSGNQLQGHIPVELGNLSSLRTLDLSFNRLDGAIPPELGNLLSLQALYLENNQLSGILPASFSQLNRLETLHLGHNRLTGTLPLDLLPSVNSLEANNNQFLGDLPPPVTESQLINFIIDDNEFLSGSLSQFFTLKRLRKLSASNTRLQAPSPESLQNLAPPQLQKLKYLELSGIQFNQPFPTHVFDVPALTIIKLSSCGFTGLLPIFTSKRLLTTLKHLDLGGNRFQGPIPSEFVGFKNIQVLKLNGNLLSGTVPKELGLLVKLVEWDLSGNPDLGVVRASSYGGSKNTVLYQLSGSRRVKYP